MQPSETPEFGHSAEGKPSLVKPALDPPLHFNTSHDGRYVLLGVSRGVEAIVGADLMRYPDDPLEVQMSLTEQVRRITINA